MKQNIILASNSPRRSELLRMLGVEFDIKSEKCDEAVGFTASPDEIVCGLAFRKARAVSDTVTSDNTIIIGADTIVWCGDKPLGKPIDRADAHRMLEMLSGNTHSVYTGIALIEHKNGEVFSAIDFVKTDVVFRVISDAEIEHYLDSGEPFDKAGAYGIQGIGGMFVREIHGDYFNVVGLPICRLCEIMAEKFGFNVL